MEWVIKAFVRFSFLYSRNKARAGVLVLVFLVTRAYPKKPSDRVEWAGSTHTHTPGHIAPIQNRRKEHTHADTQRDTTATAAAAAAGDDERPNTWIGQQKKSAIVSAGAGRGAILPL